MALTNTVCPASPVGLTSAVPKGANFDWRAIIGDPESPAGSGGEKLISLSVYVIANEDMEETMRRGHFAYHQVQDKGNGYTAVSRLKFAGIYEEWNADPDQDDIELIRPFRDELLAYLENHPRVGYVETARFPNGQVRLEFEVREDPAGGNPDLKLTLERGDN
jgi:hypothetical protein